MEKSEFYELSMGLPAIVLRVTLNPDNFLLHFFLIRSFTLKQIKFNNSDTFFAQILKNLEIYHSFSFPFREGAQIQEFAVKIPQIFPADH